MPEWIQVEYHKRDFQVYADPVLLKEGKGTPMIFMVGDNFTLTELPDWLLDENVRACILDYAVDEWRKVEGNESV